MLREITSGARTTMPAITHIAFGSGGVDLSGDPIPPEIDATGLTNELARYPISSVTAPIPTTARYVASIPPLDLASESISEAALVDSEGGVHAIKTFYIKRKDGGVEFRFTFDDEF